MRFRFSDEEERFRGEVVQLLAGWRDLDGFFRQGRQWPRVRDLFRALGARGWLSLS